MLKVIYLIRHLYAILSKLHALHLEEATTHVVSVKFQKCKYYFNSRKDSEVSEIRCVVQQVVDLFCVLAIKNIINCVMYLRSIQLELCPAKDHLT